MTKTHNTRKVMPLHGGDYIDTGSGPKPFKPESKPAKTPQKPAKPAAPAAQ